jgi:hypothetical protein
MHILTIIVNNNANENTGRFAAGRLEASVIAGLENLF